METKKYYAEDMPTAMEQIKRELGADAIIVKSRKIKQKTGPLGLFRKTMYEVVVSCDPEPTPLRLRKEAQREREKARKEAQREAQMAEASEQLPVRQPEKASALKSAPVRKDPGAAKHAAPERREKRRAGLFDVLRREKAKGTGREDAEENDAEDLREDLIFEANLMSLPEDKELEEEYKTCAMLVLPTRQECWGLVINEAASFGMPIVSTWGSGAAVEFLSKDKKNLGAMEKAHVKKIL